MAVWALYIPKHLLQILLLLTELVLIQQENGIHPGPGEAIGVNPGRKLEFMQDFDKFLGLIQSFQVPEIGAKLVDDAVAVYRAVCIAPLNP